MAINIKWTGIEQYKYGLTARWYGSQYYGNDVDVDAVGYYNPTTNPFGHGGPTRPFATISKFNQDANVAAGSVWVLDSGNWSLATGITKPCTIVGDGYVIINSTAISSNANSNNSIEPPRNSNNAQNNGLQSGNKDNNKENGPDLHKNNNGVNNPNNTTDDKKDSGDNKNGNNSKNDKNQYYILALK